MKFMILRKADKLTEAGVLPRGDLLEAMGAYHEALHAAGVLRAGEGLQPTAKGARLKMAEGKETVTDGPFAETGELIAGFSMIDVTSKQAAIDWVKRWPQLDGDVTLEIREVGWHAGCPGIDPAEAASLATLAPAPDTKRFLVLLKSNCNSESESRPEPALLDALAAFNQAGMRSGEILAGEGLRASAHGARVIVADGKMRVVDGPFTEIKALIAGFWMIRAVSKQAAIAWARRCPYPTGPNVEVEIRQLYEASDFDEAFTPAMREAEERMRAGVLDSGMQMAFSNATGQA